MVARYEQTGGNDLIVWLAGCLAEIKTQLARKYKRLVTIISHSVQVHMQWVQYHGTRPVRADKKICAHLDDSSHVDNTCFQINIARLLVPRPIVGVACMCADAKKAGGHY
jgi:hypothetical protein